MNMVKFNMFDKYARKSAVVLAVLSVTAGMLSGCGKNTAKQDENVLKNENTQSVQGTGQTDAAQQGTEPAATEPETTDPNLVAVSAKGYAIRLVDGITYVNGILIANKTYALPQDYAPGALDAEVKSAFDVMQKAAAAEGLNLYISSGYRSYSTQDTIYNNYVRQDGREKADTYSARAGHSEHQTGLCFDLNTIDDSFANTPESAWLEKHAQEYGFIIRYPKGKEHLTGYQYEPWHLRYLGNELAQKVYDSGLCLEEYLGITSQYQE